MAATPSTLRIGEAITLHAIPRNPDGSVGQLTNVSWGAGNASIATVTQDSGDPYTAYVAGVATGNTVATIYGEDAYVIHSQDTSIHVLTASRFKFSVSPLILTPDPVNASIVGVTIEAVPWDVRDDPDPPDYVPILTGILWSSANGAVLFGGPAGGSPPGTATLADALKAEVWPDVTSGDDEEVEDVITLEATIPPDGLIQSTLAVRILRTKTIEVSLVEA